MLQFVFKIALNLRKSSTLLLLQQILASDHHQQNTGENLPPIKLQCKSSKWRNNATSYGLLTLVPRDLRKSNATLKFLKHRRHTASMH